MKNVLLSASVPLPSRHPRFHSTADALAIKEAIKALVVNIIPRGRIVFGGHPAITPLISYLVASLFPHLAERAELHQSLHFEGQFPPEVEQFPNVVYTPRNDAGLQASLEDMRLRMINAYNYDAAIFIGGMEGVIDEYNLCRDNLSCKLIPLPSTGAAAQIIFDEGNFTEELNNINFSSMFRRMI